MLTILEHLDDALLEQPAHRLYRYLSGPTLFHLKGDKEPALFLSVLLHGNETSGWEVIKRILGKYKGQTLPRSISLFIGNIKAARYKKRKLVKQPDFNRVWTSGDSDENKMMLSIIEIMRQRGVFASIDIHNNNGLNPHYACVNRLHPHYLALAREFSRMVIYFIRPGGVQSLAFANFCPAVTLECGQPGDEYGIQLTTKFVDHILNLHSLQPAANIASNIDLYHTVAVVKAPDDISLSFGDQAADLQFIKGIETLNFEEIPAATTIGKVRTGIERPLIVLDEEGGDVFDQYFKLVDGQIQTTSSLMPAMLTDKITIIRQDCFCYLMEKYDIHMGEKRTLTEEPVWR